MRILISFISMLFILGACEEGEDKMVPDATKNALKERFKGAKDVHWEREGDHYEAEFQYKDKDYEAKFDNVGNWIETEHEIDSLPKVVKDGFANSKYGKYNIREIEKASTPNYEELYQIEIDKEGKEKDVYFSVTGDFVMETKDK